MNYQTDLTRYEADLDDLNFLSLSGLRNSIYDKLTTTHQTNLGTDFKIFLVIEAFFTIIELGSIFFRKTRPN
jgi:hypothetical protein